MTTTQQDVSGQGLGKLGGPPLGFAVAEILCWLCLQFLSITVPTNIEMDMALVLSMVMVYILPHDILTKNPTPN